MQLLVNSVDHDHGREWLPTPDALREWLGENGLGVAETPSVDDLSRAIALREALRELLRLNTPRLDTGSDAQTLNVHGREVSTASATVNAVARMAGLRLELDAAGALRVDVGAGGVEGALGQVVAVVFEAMLDGSWTRLKVCRNCRWAFYDPSKNRSGTWCSMQLCGNRSKTREYRRRKAGGQ